jgi:hypothetical protein
MDAWTAGQCTCTRLVLGFAELFQPLAGVESGVVPVLSQTMDVACGTDACRPAGAAGV